LFPLFEKELNADKAAAIGVEIKTILETKQ
jgi:hypothetical protein